MAQTHPLVTPWEQEHAARLRGLALVLVGVGLVWRFSRYLLAFPIWGDEAFVLVNYFTRGYADLFGPIDNCQIAPLLFHVLELTAFRCLGPSELAVRLPAFVACLASVPLFWHLARLILPPLGHTLAVGIFSVSIWPATMGSLVKPYAFDLFFSLALLVPAVHWLLHPRSLRPLVMLALVAPLAMIGSYPAAFVGGAIGLVLLPAVWKRRDVRAGLLLAAYGVLLTGTFAGHYLFVATAHLASPVNGVTTAVGMDQYWAGAFPPGDPWQFLPWLLFIHTGQGAAYPIGSADGGSGLTALLGLIGMVWLWRHERRWLVALTLAVFALGLIAAALRKYPYLLSCRLSQHLAPLYCLNAGLGVAVLILWAREERRGGLVLAAASVLGLIGLGGTVRDFLHPYREENALTCRRVASELFARAGSDPVLVPLPPQALDATLHWYLRQQGVRVLWTSDLSAAAGTADSLWVVNVGLPGNESSSLEEALSQGPARWRSVERRSFVLGREPLADRLTLGRYLHLIRERAGGEEECEREVSETIVNQVEKGER